MDGTKSQVPYSFVFQSAGGANKNLGKKIRISLKICTPLGLIVQFSNLSENLSENLFFGLFLPQKQLLTNFGGVTGHTGWYSF